MFRTDNALTLPISGTGSAGMEAAFVNVVEPGDAVVVGVNGVFGERMCDVAAPLRRRGRPGRAPSGASRSTPQRLLDAHPRPKVIAVVHAETSTGVRNDIDPIGAGKGDALLLVDCVTSLGGIPVDDRRLGRRRRLQRHAEVPRRAAGPGAGHRVRRAAASASSSGRQSWYLDLQHDRRVRGRRGAPARTTTPRRSR